MKKTVLVLSILILSGLLLGCETKEPYDYTDVYLRPTENEVEEVS